MKSWYSKLGYLCVVVLLNGCAATSLGQLQPVNDAEVSLVDKRIQSEKVSYRETVLTPLAFLGDADFDASPVAHLRVALAKRRSQGASRIDAEITKLRIADSFPRRQAAAIAGGLSGALFSRGYTVVSTLNQSTVDGVVCLLEGTFNGKPVRASEFVPYQISPLAGLVRTQPEFIAAVKTSIERCADVVLEQIVYL